MMLAVLLGVVMLLGTSLPDAAAREPARAEAPPAAVAAQAAPPSASGGALPTPQFRRYGTANGLPSSSVYSVVQDPGGAIWFGTKSGIARYDGVDFKVFRHAAGDPGSLYNNGIGALLIDRDGRLWAGGLEAGLNRYDAAGDRFVHWGHDPADPASLASDKVWTIAQTADGRLWVGGAGGLDRLRPDGRGFEHMHNPLRPGAQGNFGTVSTLFVDARGQLWIGSEHGVFRRDAGGTLHPVVQPGRTEPIDAWSIDGSGDEIRIAAPDSLLLVGPDDIARPLVAPAIPATNVMSSTRDAAGRLWIGTQKGLFLQQHSGGEVIPVVNVPVLNGNLPGTWVWKVMTDREGGLWVALLDGGVAYLAPGWYGFSRFTHIPDDDDSLRDSIATAVARGRDGRVWVGERNGRVDKLEPSTGKVEHVLSGLHGDVVGMTEDPGRRLWIATRGALYRYANGKVDRVDPQARQMKRPLEVEVGPDGRLYARTFGDGVFRIDQDSLAVSAVKMVGADEKARWGSQMTLHRGVYWYASDGGMLRLDASHDHLEPIPGIANDRAVHAFHVSDDGLWLARSDGLEHYHYQGDGVVLDRTIGAAEGWPSIDVVDLRVDRQKRIWIFGQDGLWRFDQATGAFRKMGLQDGLTNGEFFRGYSLMPDGNLYAPTQGGLIGFNPDKICEQSSVPQLALTQVSVHRRGRIVNLPYRQPQISIGWRDRELGVVARVFSYVDPAANRYRFRLNGFDSGWVDAGSRGEREFAGLGPGDYTLDVMAAGANGAWAHLSTPLRIHVDAPPWMRWWAWLAYALCFALGVWLFLWVWRRRLAQRHRIQLAEQQRQLAEQASAAKTQFLATLSHEIRTPMTGVMGMAELLLTTPLNPQQSEYTQAMQRSGGMLLKLLNDALDLARIEAGRLELEPAPFDPRQLVNDVAQLEIGQARVKGLRFTVDLADDLPARVIGDPVRVKQVLLNLANNALKFTEFGSVLLRASRTREGLLFSVSDTGPGISEASQSRLFQRFEQVEGPQRRAGSGLGLAICRELVDMMGGSIELASRLGHGSTFHVRLPLRAPEVAAHPAPPPLDAEGEPCLRVLLIEDDTIVAAVIRGLLEHQRHRIQFVANGLAALAELAHARHDVVLLDLDLPGVDGFEVARLIRQCEGPGQHLPIVAITARSGGDDEARARSAGMDGFLRKPFTGEQLAEALAGVVVRAASLRAAAEAAAGPA
ncbi:histidine kinase [Frateuria sp. Soil773]|uniref:hybrid sensor histidine kinase/response regulator n=1 Tax=Frateuria sp. Soil773 TaxID=1736407 RepID=UPI0006F483D8|nr:two-component regulator propeller domain-containing protein [Frateuria sp. Soil773]KRF00353.1 histidine kinase [Frateuria sp. Soil773]